jgi:hypothetical protein
MSPYLAAGDSFGRTGPGSPVDEPLISALGFAPGSPGPIPGVAAEGTPAHNRPILEPGGETDPAVRPSLTNGRVQAGAVPLVVAHDTRRGLEHVTARCGTRDRRLWTSSDWADGRKTSVL